MSFTSSHSASAVTGVCPRPSSVSSPPNSIERGNLPMCPEHRPSAFQSLRRTFIIQLPVRADHRLLIHSFPGQKNAQVYWLKLLKVSQDKDVQARVEVSTVISLDTVRISMLNTEEKHFSINSRSAQLALRPQADTGVTSVTR